MAKIREINDYLKFANYGANFNIREKMADNLIAKLSEFGKVDSREDIASIRSEIVDIAEKEHKFLPKELKGAAYAKNNIIEDMKTEILHHSSHYTFITYVLLWKYRKSPSNKDSSKLRDLYISHTLANHIINIVDRAHKCEAAAMEQLYYMEFDIRAILIESLLLCFNMAFDVYCLEANGIYWRNQFITNKEEKKHMEDILVASTKKAKDIEQKMKENKDNSALKTELMHSIKNILIVKKAIASIEQNMQIADNMTTKLCETIYISNLMMIKSHALLYRSILLDKYYKSLLSSLKIKKNKNDNDLLVSRCYAEEFIDEMSYIYYMHRVFGNLLKKDIREVGLD